MDPRATLGFFLLWWIATYPIPAFCLSWAMLRVKGKQHGTSDQLELKSGWFGVVEEDSLGVFPVGTEVRIRHDETLTEAERGEGPLVVEHNGVSYPASEQTPAQSIEGEDHEIRVLELLNPPV